MKARLRLLRSTPRERAPSERAERRGERRVRRPKRLFTREERPAQEGFRVGQASRRVNHPGDLLGAFGVLSLGVRGPHPRQFPPVVQGDEQLAREVIDAVLPDGNLPALHRSRRRGVRLVQTPPRRRQLAARDVQSLSRQSVRLLQTPLEPR